MNTLQQLSPADQASSLTKSRRVQGAIRSYLLQLHQHPGDMQGALAAARKEIDSVAEGNELIRCLCKVENQ